MNNAAKCLARWRIRANRNLALGLTTRGTPRKRRPNGLLTRADKRRIERERAQRRADRFRAAGLTAHGTVPTHRWMSAAEKSWRALRANIDTHAPDPLEHLWKAAA